MAAPSESMEDSFPSELQDKLTSFDESLTNVETVMKPLLTQPRSDIHERLSVLEQARLDLVEAYALNSLFWMYLNVLGQKPKEHPVKQELDRIRSYMDRLKALQDKEKAPKLDTVASKKFVRSALWQAAHKKSEECPDSPSNSNTQTPRKPPHKKLRTDSPYTPLSNETPDRKKKKKKT